MAKINFNTDLQLAWSKKMKQFIEENKNVYDPRKIIKSGENALKKIIDEKIELLK